MSAAPQRAMNYWLMLTPAEQAEAIRKMARTGWTDHGIAGATKLSVEQIRRILSGPQEIAL